MAFLLCTSFAGVRLGIFASAITVAEFAGSSGSGKAVAGEGDFKSAFATGGTAFAADTFPAALFFVVYTVTILFVFVLATFEPAVPVIFSVDLPESPLHSGNRLSP